MKLIVQADLPLDGVMQSPGLPDEDRSGGFDHGGWLVPYADDVFQASEPGSRNTGRSPSRSSGARIRLGRTGPGGAQWKVPERRRGPIPWPTTPTTPTTR